MDTDTAGKENQVDSCKHGTNPAWCADCAEPVRRPVDFEARHVNAWTADEENILREYRDFSSRDLTELLPGRTAAAITTHRFILENPTSEAAKQYRRTELNDRLRAAASQANEPWSANEDEVLMKGIADGATYEAIAELLNRSLKAIDDRLYKLRRGEAN